MKIILLADLHGKTAILPRFEAVLHDADLVLLAGDITHFGRGMEMEQIISGLSRINPNLMAVTGNCDYPRSEQYLCGLDRSLTCRVKEYQGIALAGMNGSLPCPGKTPQEYEEEEFEACLNELGPAIHQPFIFLTHQPPFNTLNDTLPSGEHVGSRSIRRFIEMHNPLICCTGHIHEGSGIDTLGKTRVVNPGPAKDGYYAMIWIEQGSLNDVAIFRANVNH